MDCTELQEKHIQQLAQIPALVDRIEKIENKVENIPVLEKLLEQVIHSNSIQGEALIRLDRTIDKISSALDSINNNQEELKVDQEKMQQSINTLKEERSLNLITLFKDNFLSIIAFIFLLYEALNKLGII